ncbi:MAG: hypothetical protein AB7H90_09540 [Alphaproteobacteria bacterium]
MTMHEQTPETQEVSSTWHSYPASAMIGDYLRAAAGIVPAGAIFATVPVAPFPATVLGGFAIVFGIFGLRTALRHNTSIEIGDIGIRARGLVERRIAWAELDRVKLSYYSTRRDRKSGWMQLELSGGGTKLGLDSRIEGFGEVARRAAEAAYARQLQLSESTAANLEALGIRIPEWQIERY